MATDAFPPLIAVQINYLLSHSPPSIKIDYSWAGCKYTGLQDRFSLLIPFCLDYIKWDVIYNAQCPLAAPDIIVGAEDENFHPFSVLCKKATVLVVSAAFTFLHFTSQGAPVKSHLLTEYPWSPRWEPSVMAERIFEFLLGECLNFKKYCNETQLQQL